LETCHSKKNPAQGRVSVFLVAGRISPSALRAPVALAADRDASASLRLRVNLLSTQNRILTAIAKMKKPAPMGPALFILVAGARFGHCLFSLPRGAKRVRLK